MSLPCRIMIFTLFLAYTSKAQEYLSIDAAIKIGLEKNYDVSIAKNKKDIAAAQNNAGNAGMSPSLSINTNLNLANINSHLEFNTGAVQDRTGANSSNFGASLNLNWTIFDGLKMFAVKKRLYHHEQLNAIAFKQQMELTVYNIILAYYEVVRLLDLIEAAEQNMRIFAERKKIATLKFETGADSKVDLLLTRSDENKAKSDILQLQLQLAMAKVALNNLLARPADMDFKTSDSITVNYNPALEDLKRTSDAGNSSLLISRQNQLIGKQFLEEARAGYLPFVQLNGAYNFTRLKSQAGIIFLNRQQGLSGGLSAGWLLYYGNKNNRLIKERQIELLNQNYASEKIRQEIDALVYMNYQSFITGKKILDLEKQNLDDSKEVLNISLERYKVGKANLLETIETQKKLEDAQVRYVNALYALKKAETELLRANGSLVK